MSLTETQINDKVNEWTSNNLCIYSAFKEIEHTFPFLKYGLHRVTFFQKIQYGRGEKK